MSSKTKTIKLNVGGTHYEVSRSLIESFPNTMLARMIGEMWQDANGGDTAAEVGPIFIDRDGDRFRYILDFMRESGTTVCIPPNVSREALLNDFAFDGLVVDDPSMVAYCDHTVASASAVAQLDRKMKVGFATMGAKLQEQFIEYKFGMLAHSLVEEKLKYSGGVFEYVWSPSKAEELGIEYDFAVDMMTLNSCLAEYGFEATTNTWSLPSKIYRLKYIR
jgi:BTB/POZ domain